MGIRILESGKLLLVEFWILDFGIWNIAQGIRNPTNDWKPESKFHWQRIRNPVAGIRNPESWIRGGMENKSHFFYFVYGLILQFFEKQECLYERINYNPDQNSHLLSWVLLETKPVIDGLT